MTKTFEIYCSIFDDTDNAERPVWISGGRYQDGILTLTCESDSADLRLELKEVLGEAAPACEGVRTSRLRS